MKRGAGIGRVVATEATPATPHEFRFRAAADEDAVGIGALVRVSGDGGRRVYAVVTDGRAYEADGETGNGKRETILWTASVLRQVPPEPLRPVPIADVYLAAPEDVAVALRMDAYSAGLPVGLYGSEASRAPVQLDPDFLVGPEAAHLNVGGVSGLATKTSAMVFLLAGAFQCFPRSKGTIAAVCFNVKGGDLCFLDQAASLSEPDGAMYRALGLEPRPFARTRYFAPFKPDGVNLNTLRSHEELRSSVQPLVWGLPEVLEYAEVLLNREDIDAKADAFIDFLGDRVIGREFADDWGGVHRVTSFADLDRLFRAIFDGLEQKGGRSDMWRTHHVATMRKVRNRLLNISVRCRGLVADDGSSNDLPFGAFEDRAVYVLDLAGTDQLAQDLVFTRVVSKLREHLERRDLGVEHVIVLVDELNKYAPADGPESYVREMLLDIAERGRYLGLVLFGAQQFRSQVHRRVVGNAATAIFGRSDLDELGTAGYQGLSPATKIKLATLPKGELMVRHPHFTQPVFVRFPRPPVLLGGEGLDRFPPAADAAFDEAVTRQLAALDRRVAAATVRDLIADRDQDDVRRALLATRRAQPDDPVSFFRARLGPRVAREGRDQVAPGVRPLSSLEDPYASQ
ncbi:MAG: ATP-binding protein [Gemmatimonadetes bacterium]|nr:ATP-binding protein [Gemmatimonadota bacterium]MBI2536562.1 ATP-binding protein [Gemmatimonadota bacterium]